MLRLRRLVSSGYHSLQHSCYVTGRFSQLSSTIPFIRNYSDSEISNERMDYDVVIVGGGCAGLSSAIRLKREASKRNQELSICVLEKGESIGSHVLSGCLMETDALSILIPDWKERNSPISQKVEKESMCYIMNTGKGFSIPSFIIPSPARHSSSYIVSLSNVCRWLGSIAEEEGIDVFTDISASDLITDKNDRVVGVLSSDKGVDKEGQPKEDYQPGYAFFTKCLILAEGALGSITEQVISKYHLQSSHSRTYGLGIKEIWEIPNGEMKPGSVLHTIGYPLQRSLFDSVYGGGFAYCDSSNYLHIGYITGLDYKNTYLSPYEEFQLFKKTDVIGSLLKNGKRVEYGARVIYEGGYLGQCKPVFPGGCIVGDSLGVVNMASLQGSNNAIENGILLADSLIKNWDSVKEGKDLIGYEESLKNSKLTKQLKHCRSLRATYEKGVICGMTYAFISGTMLLNHNLFTHSLSKGEDYEKTLSSHDSKSFSSRGYEKPDDKLTFSRETSLAHSSISYPQDQLSHITVKEDMKSVPVDVSCKEYDAPEERFCPAHVYEYCEDNNGEKKLEIHSENCLHCKTCVVKMPKQYVEWKAPSSGGPNYSNM